MYSIFLFIWPRRSLALHTLPHEYHVLWRSARTNRTNRPRPPDVAACASEFLDFLRAGWVLGWVQSVMLVASGSGFGYIRGEASSASEVGR